MLRLGVLLALALGGCVHSYLSVELAGDGAGDVVSDDGAIDCGDDCGNTIYGPMVLTATAHPGSKFEGWRGGGCTGTGTCEIERDGDVTVTAVFEPYYLQLTVARSGEGAGSILSEDAALDCSDTCVGTVQHASEVTLTAVPANGSSFFGWTSTGPSLSLCGETCTLTVLEAMTVTGEFQPDIPLTVSIYGNGSVVSKQPGIDCGADCSESYRRNSTVMLSPVVPPESYFDGWGGACAATGTYPTCTVYLEFAADVTASFSPRPMYSVSVTRTGGGTVTTADGGIQCGADCTQLYPEGTLLTFSATATSGIGSTFTRWTGWCDNSTNTTCSFVIGGPVTIGAEFATPNPSLSLGRTGDGAGELVTPLFACPREAGGCSSSPYAYGTQVTVTATAINGSVFAGWSGDCSGTGTCTITLDAPRSVVATFTSTQPCGEIRADGKAKLVFNFREGTGTTTEELVGDGADGSLVGATWTTGRFGSGVAFDGVNDHVVRLGPVAVGNWFTVDGWIKSQDGDGNGVILRSESTAYALALAGGKLVFRAGNGSAWTELVGPTITNGQWHYVAAEWDVSTVHLWLDGVEVATMPITFFVSVQNNATYIGGMPGDAHFGGTIDELRVSVGRRGSGITSYYATATSCP